MRHFFKTVIFRVLQILNGLLQTKSVKKPILKKQLQGVFLFLEHNNVANYAEDIRPYAMKEGTLQVLKKVEEKVACIFSYF